MTFLGHICDAILRNLFNNWRKFFQLHLEAAHVLKYSEEEFLQTLDWKPISDDNGNEKSGEPIISGQGWT